MAEKRGQFKVCDFCCKVTQMRKIGGDYPRYKITAEKEGLTDSKTVKTFYLCPDCYKKFKTQMDKMRDIVLGRA